jgi:hypothetical protein
MIVLVIATVCCNRLSSVITAPRSIIQGGDVVRAEGSWRKVGGTLWASPMPNTYRIECNTRSLECREDGAWIDNLPSGSLGLELLPTVEYRIVSWKDGILIAEHEFSNGNSTLRISVSDKTASRTWRGTRARGVGLDADKWREEVLQ